jgi:CBS-domain-containing membrane protein
VILFEKFKNLWKYYLFQSFLAGLALFIIIFAIQDDKFVVIASMGATTFICFAMPKAVSAQTRQVIGGHLVGLLCGAVFTFVQMPGFVEFPVVAAVTIFLMVALDVEHPPAVGTAIAVTINEVDRSVALAIMVSVIIITQVRYYLRHYLKDLV